MTDNPTAPDVSPVLRTPPAGTHTVQIADIVAREDWQVRTRIDGGTVRSYATAMRSGANFPPVVLARIEGALYLVDGWHRLEAAKLNGEAVIAATVSGMSEAEAQVAAALANLTHGLPLKSREVRNVFRTYIRSGHHRRGRGFKSYRDIATDLANRVTHNTVRNRMRQDFPGVFRAMGGLDPLPETGGGRGMPVITPLDSAKASLDQAAAEARRLSPKDRRALLAHLREVAERVRAVEAWEPEPWEAEESCDF